MPELVTVVVPSAKGIQKYLFLLVFRSVSV